MEWLGRAKLDFVASPKPARMLSKDGSKTNFLEVCKAVVPPCQLNPLLFNGHLHTLYTSARADAPAVYYKRKIFEADHAAFNGSFAVDFATAPFKGSEEPALPARCLHYTEEELAELERGSDDDRPMLVVMHGLAGGSNEVYLLHAIGPLLDSGKWEACVVISRGCGRSKITTGVLYNARATWDYRQTVKWLRKTYPNRLLFGIGFSLGANLLVNYLGEEGSACELKAAVALANPWNLEVSSKMLRSTFLGHEVYQRAMGGHVLKMAQRHKEQIIKNTNIDYDKLQGLTYLHEFDRAYQCPTWGYPTEDAYYRDASSSDTVMGVRVPLLALHAMDDPIAHHAALPCGEIATNPYTILCTTSMGGHLGWFELGGGRWHTKPVTNFFNHMAFEVDLDSISHETVETPGKGYAPTNFDPVRRKMQVDLK